MTKEVMFIVKGKAKDINIMKDVSLQFGRIFSKETTFGEIHQLKKEDENATRRTEDTISKET